MREVYVSTYGAGSYLSCRIFDETSGIVPDYEFASYC